MKDTNRGLSLYQPTTYQITVLGITEAQWDEWVEGITVAHDWYDGDLPTTVLTCTVDQAALHGLLRRLYGLGLPLISVICKVSSDGQIG